MLLASDFDKSKYFRAADISGDLKLRIKNVTAAEVGQGADKERKLIVWFTNDDRGLPLNKTNIRTLSGAFGDSCDGWKGRVIVLFTQMVDFRRHAQSGFAGSNSFTEGKRPAGKDDAAG